MPALQLHPDGHRLRSHSQQPGQLRERGAQLLRLLGGQLPLRLGHPLYPPSHPVFAFPPGTTSLTKTVTTLVPVQPNSFKNANALQNYEYLAGVSSQDGNFALTFNNPEFEATNGKLDVEVSIEDMQAATLEVVIGYLIFDTTVYKIEAFENLQFSENWIQNNMLVAIGNVKKRPPSAPARLLQTTPLLGMASAGSASSSISGSFFSSSNFSSSGSASEGLWNTTKGDTFIFSSNSSSNFSFSSDGTKVSFNYSSYTSTELIIELRRGSLDLKKIDYKLVQLNDKVYKSLMDADGIVDGSKLTKQQLASLYDPNALPPTPALTTRSTSQPQPAQPPQTPQPLQAAQPSSSDATMAVAPSVRTAAAAAPSSGDSFAGQSNQIFN